MLDASIATAAGFPACSKSIAGFRCDLHDLHFVFQLGLVRNELHALLLAAQQEKRRMRMGGQRHDRVGRRQR